MGLVKRAHGIPALSAIGDTSFDQLAADLTSPDASLRRQAARLLVDHPQGISLLCARLADESVLSVRSIIISGLIAVGTPAVVEGLLPHLRSEDAALRNLVIEALQQMPEAVAPHIEKLLDDEDPDVRIFTANILSALPHPSVPVWLRRIVEHDPHVNVCCAAVDALAEVGDEDVIPALEALARRFFDINFVSYAVNAAVRRIRGR